MTLFLAGGYSCGNPGDEAILKSTVYRLQELFPSARFVIWADSDDFRPQFDRPVDHEMFYWKPLRWRRRPGLFSRAATKLYVELYPVSKELLASQAFFDKRAMRALKACDKVVFVGGGYINSEFCLLEINYLAAVAVRLAKPVYLLGQTLGPFVRPTHQRMAKDIFRHAETIVLRDSDSTFEVPDHARVWIGSDDAVPFQPRLPEEKKAAIDALLSPEGLKIGLSLRRWKDSRAHYRSIAQAFGWLAGQLGQKIQVVFIPMETSVHCDDRLEAAEFAQHLPPGVSFTADDRPLSVEQTHYLIGRMDLLVGMRLHALVFALSNGVPAVGLYQGEYYHRKISGLFRSFRVGKHLLPLERAAGLGPLMRSLLARSDEVHARLIANRARIVNHQRQMLEQAVRSERTP